LSVYAVLLQQRSGQSDLIVGTPMTGRTRPEFAGVAGFFDNTVPLRLDLGGDPSFAELMARVQRVGVEAFEHPDYPMPALVERLTPLRDPSRNPIFDVLFALRKAHLHEAERLTMLSFGGAAVEIERDGLRIRSRNIPRHCSQLDLTLGTTEFEGEIRAYWEYR